MNLQKKIGKFPGKYPWRSPYEINFQGVAFLKEYEKLQSNRILLSRFNARFFLRKLFFCLSLNFLNIMLEIRLRFS